MDHRLDDLQRGGVGGRSGLHPLQDVDRSHRQRARVLHVLEWGRIRSAVGCAAERQGQGPHGRGQHRSAGGRSGGGGKDWDVEVIEQTNSASVEIALEEGADVTDGSPEVTVYLRTSYGGALVGYELPAEMKLNAD
jgi:hypothetical protein